MNYTQVLESIKSASLFDLYRLNVAIRHEMENPQRISELRNNFAAGEKVSYFDANTNKLDYGIVIQKNLKYVVIRSDADNKIWNIPYCLLNLQNIDTDIHVSNKEKLSKNTLKVGDGVEFNKDGKLIAGKVIRLNFKTVTLLTPANHRWRVSYGALFRYIDADFEKSFNPELLNAAINSVD